MSKFKRRLDIAKAKQKLAKEPQKLEIITSDQKEIVHLHNDLNDLATLLQNVLTDKSFQNTIENKLIDLNNAVVLLTQAIGEGLMIKNQPILDQVVISNLKDIKIPDEIKVKNPGEFPKDLATNKNIKDFQTALVKALDQVRVAVKEGVSIPDGPVKQEVADYTPSRRVVMKGYKLKFDDSAISDLRIPVPLPSYQNQAGQASRVILNADGSIPVDGSTAGDVAAGTTDSGNPVKIGGVARTVEPTSVTGGQRVDALFTKSGKLVVRHALREMLGNQQTTITSSTGETTIVTADATYLQDLYGLILTNTSATATKVTIKDSTSGTTRAVFQVPATDTRGFMLPADSGHKQSAANNNWTATCGTSVASLEVTALFAKAL